MTQDPKISKNEFKRLMVQLRGCYPSLKMTTEEWVLTLRSYYFELFEVDPEVITRAFAKATSIHPKFFPSLGQLKDLVRSSEKAVTARKASARPVASLPPHKPLKSQNLFSRLAEKWQQEIDFGERPVGERARLEIHKRRMKEFWYTWEHVIDGKHQESGQ